MVRFYELYSRNTMTKVEALREAQLALLNGRYKKGEIPLWRRGPVAATPGKDRLPQFKRDNNAPYAHPYFWSPFVLIGNWK